MCAAVARAAQRMPPAHRRAFLARNVILDVAAELVGTAAQPLQVAGDQFGMLVGDAIDFLCGALGGGMGEPQELDEVIGGAERPATRFRIHCGSIAREVEPTDRGDYSAWRVVRARR